MSGLSTAYCARCDGKMVTTPDAIGRPRHRCPRCDGVSAPRPRHPDDAMIPQGLVRVQQLPPVAPGQLRCQQCARGVEGRARFCAACVHLHKCEARRRMTAEAFAPKPCGRCAATFQPTGPNSQYCGGCR